jgi:hypothetical protein
MMMKLIVWGMFAVVMVTAIKVRLQEKSNRELLEFVTQVETARE